MQVPKVAWIKPSVSAARTVMNRMNCKYLYKEISEYEWWIWRQVRRFCYWKCFVFVYSLGSIEKLHLSVLCLHADKQCVWRVKETDRFAIQQSSNSWYCPFFFFLNVAAFSCRYLAKMPLSCHHSCVLRLHQKPKMLTIASEVKWLSDNEWVLRLYSTKT